MLAGVVALALTGAGTAIAWSAADSPSPTPSPSALGKSGESAPGKPGKVDKGKVDKSQRPQQLHSESVVKKADGTFETQLTQQGTVGSVSPTSVTVKSEDGFTRSYAVNAETKITKFPPPAADGSPAKGDDGKRLKPTAGTIADIAAGDAVRISGVKNGDQATAARIVEGAAHGPGLGLGHGHSNGHKASTSTS
ncbi:MAG: hypothetical protein NVS1B16_13890 [Pseudarthrobacter sp.]